MQNLLEKKKFFERDQIGKEIHDWRDRMFSLICLREYFQNCLILKIPIHLKIMITLKRFEEMLDFT